MDKPLRKNDGINFQIKNKKEDRTTNTLETFKTMSEYYEQLCTTNLKKPTKWHFLKNINVWNEFEKKQKL